MELKQIKIKKLKTFKCGTKEQRKICSWNYGDTYTLLLEYKNNYYIYNFNDNINNKSTKTDWLFAIINDYTSYKDYQDLQSFLDGFGYSGDNVKAGIKAFNECKKTYQALNKIFTPDELEYLIKWSEKHQ